MRKLFLTAIATATLTGFAAPAAQAASPSAGLQYMRDYNLIVLGDANMKSDVEGRTFIKGNLNGNSANFYTTPGASAHPGLQVVGNVNGGTKNLNNAAGAEVGGNVTSGFNLNGPGLQTVKAGGAISNTNVNGNTVLQNQAGLNTQLTTLGTDIQQSLNQLSAYFAGLGASDTASVSSNLITFDPAGAGSLAVFNLSGTSNFANHDFKIVPAGFDTIVINVPGINITLPSSTHFQNGSGLGQSVIWNFYEAQTITFGDAFYGSVLAPKAFATNSNFIEGSSVFGSLAQNGEFHLSGYGANLTITGVPEPATWAMMILGFGGVGAVLRRRRALAVA